MKAIPQGLVRELSALNAEVCDALVTSGIFLGSKAQSSANYGLFSIEMNNDYEAAKQRANEFLSQISSATNEQELADKLQTCWQKQTLTVSEELIMDSIKDINKIKQFAKTLWPILEKQHLDAKINETPKPTEQNKAPRQPTGRQVWGPRIDLPINDQKPQEEVNIRLDDFEESEDISGGKISTGRDRNMTTIRQGLVDKSKPVSTSPFIVKEYKTADTARDAFIAEQEKYRNYLIGNNSVQNNITSDKLYNLVTQVDEGTLTVRDAIAFYQKAIDAQQHAIALLEKNATLLEAIRKGYAKEKTVECELEKKKCAMQIDYLTITEGLKKQPAKTAQEAWSRQQNGLRHLMNMLSALNTFPPNEQYYREEQSRAAQLFDQINQSYIAKLENNLRTSHSDQNVVDLRDAYSATKNFLLTHFPQDFVKAKVKEYDEKIRLLNEQYPSLQSSSQTDSKAPTRMGQMHMISSSRDTNNTTNRSGNINDNTKPRPPTSSAFGPFPDLTPDLDEMKNNSLPSSVNRLGSDHFAPFTSPTGSPFATKDKNGPSRIPRTKLDQFANLNQQKDLSSLLLKHDDETLRFIKSLINEIAAIDTDLSAAEQQLVPKSEDYDVLKGRVDKINELSLATYGKTPDQILSEVKIRNMTGLFTSEPAYKTDISAPDANNKYKMFAQRLDTLKAKLPASPVLDVDLDANEDDLDKQEVKDEKVDNTLATSSPSTTSSTTTSTTKTPPKKGPISFADSEIILHAGHVPQRYKELVKEFVEKPEPLSAPPSSSPSMGVLVNDPTAKTKQKHPLTPTPTVLSSMGITYFKNSEYFDDTQARINIVYFYNRKEVGKTKDDNDLRSDEEKRIDKTNADQQFEFGHDNRIIFIEQYNKAKGCWESKLYHTPDNTDHTKIDNLAVMMRGINNYFKSIENAENKARLANQSKWLETFLKELADTKRASSPGKVLTEQEIRACLSNDKVYYAFNPKLTNAQFGKRYPGANYQTYEKNYEGELKKNFQFTVQTFADKAIAELNKEIKDRKSRTTPRAGIFGWYKLPAVHDTKRLLAMILSVRSLNGNETIVIDSAKNTQEAKDIMLICLALSHMGIGTRCFDERDVSMSDRITEKQISGGKIYAMIAHLKENYHYEQILGREPLYRAHLDEEAKAGRVSPIIEKMKQEEEDIRNKAAKEAKKVQEAKDASQPNHSSSVPTATPPSANPSHSTDNRTGPTSRS